jgi:hypothetical protein
VPWRWEVEVLDLPLARRRPDPATLAELAEADSGRADGAAHARRVARLDGGVLAELDCDFTVVQPSS